MADSPIKPSKADQDLEVLSRYNSALLHMKGTIDSDNKSLETFTNTFKQFNGELKELIQLTNKNKLSLNLGLTDKGSSKSKGSSKPKGDTKPKDTDTPKNTNKKNKKIIEGEFKDLNTEIIKSTNVLEKELTNKLSNLAGAIIGGVSKNSTSVILQNAGSAAKSAISAGSNATKAIQLGLKAHQASKLAATATNKSIAAGATETAAGATAAGLSATAGAALAAGAAIAALGVAAKVAADRQSQVARSLTVMNQRLTDTSKTALSVHNKQIKIGNAFENVADRISSALLPAFDALAGVVLNIIEATGISTKESNVKQTGVQGAISSSAQQSGFNVGSANVLARDTYKLAEEYHEKFGDTTEQMSKNLADAWLNGSDAAKDYGVVVDDLTLIGYTASKGIDIVNVEISDAMRQYYRFELAQEELNASSRDAMSNQIRSWKQYGQLIDSTKQKLFSFDEVIQLTAVDTTIPDLGSASLNETLENKITTPTIPPTTPNNPFSPLTVPVSPIVNPPVSDVIAELESIPENIDVGVDVVGEEKVRQLQAELEALSKAVGVNVVTNVQGKDQVDALINACIEATKPWEAQLRTTVPQYDLIVDVLNKYRTLDGTDWQAQLNLITLGQETIDQAYDSLVQTQGQYYADVIFKVSGLSDLQKAVALARELNGMKSGAYASVTSGTKYANVYASTLAKATSNTGVSKTNLSSLKNQIPSVLNKNSTKNKGLTVSQSLVDKVAKTSTTSSNNKTLEAINRYASTHEISKQKLTNKQNAYEFGTTLDKNIKALTAGLALATGAGYGVGALTAGAASTAGATSTTGAAVQKGAVPLDLVLDNINSKVTLSNSANLADYMNYFNAKLVASGIPKFASGGIGTKESLIHAFEGDKAEAVIPLESQQGVDYLANALQQAGAGDGGGSSSVVVNVNLSGLNLADNDAQWERVGRKISEVIEIQTQRRGKLSYGSK